MDCLRSFVAPLLTSSEKSVCGARDQPLYWLDEILGGGLQRPDGFPIGRSLVCLVCGPPGACKSLFVQDLCYSRALAAMEESEGSETWPRMVVISTEAPSGAIAENMKSLGWVPDCRGKKVYWDASYQVRKSKPLDHLLSPEGSKVTMPDPVPPLTILSPVLTQGPVGIEEFMNGVAYGWNMIGSTHPDLLVIDSLNVLLDRMERTRTRTWLKSGDGRDKQNETEHEVECISDVYEHLTHRLQETPKFLFLVLDDHSSDASWAFTRHPAWEYMADVVLRLDFTYENDGYFSRYIEVVKTRFQTHVLGRQLFKIFPGEANRDPGMRLDTDPEGARPNLRRGGVFVFPSEHYILSQIRSGKPLVQVKPDRPKTLKWAASVKPLDDQQMKVEDAFLEEPVAYGPGDLAPPAGLTDASRQIDWEDKNSGVSLNWPVAWCYELVGGFGVPLRDTTAVIGRRGLHKSHFCYQYILDGVCNGEQTLVISFRDNRAAVLSTLLRIAGAPHYQHRIDQSAIAEKTTVLYQRPGYVTPQEFLHRIVTAVSEYKPTRVVVNAVDEWKAAYPLLARSPILVPALVDFLNSHEATTLVVGVESKAAWDISGLTSKAEVVLAFEYQNLEWATDSAAVDFRKSQGYAADGFPPGCRLRIPPQTKTSVRQPKVVVCAMRVPHGRAGLARAVVEYDQTPDRAPAGLRLVPIAPEYPVGLPL